MQDGGHNLNARGNADNATDGRVNVRHLPTAITRSGSRSPVDRRPRAVPRPTLPPWHAPLPPAVSDWVTEGLGNLVVAGCNNPAEADRVAMTLALRAQGAGELIAVFATDQFSDQETAGRAIDADILVVLGVGGPTARPVSGSLISAILTRWLSRATTVVTLGTSVSDARDVRPALERAVGRKCASRLADFGEAVVVGEAVRSA